MRVEGGFVHDYTTRGHTIHRASAWPAPVRWAAASSSSIVRRYACFSGPASFVCPLTMAERALHPLLEGSGASSWSVPSGSQELSAMRGGHHAPPPTTPPASCTWLAWVKGRCWHRCCGLPPATCTWLAWIKDRCCHWCGCGLPHVAGTLLAWVNDL